MAVAITISTFGFLSQGMLTAPRVYFAMATDGLFFRWPDVAAAQVEGARRGNCAARRTGLAVAVSGKYEQILNYVVSIDFIFFGLTGLSVFIFRKRGASPRAYRTPGHPFTTIFFIAPVGSSSWRRFIIIRRTVCSVSCL